MEHYKENFSNSTITDPADAMVLLNQVWTAGTARQLIERLQHVSNNLEDLDNRMDNILLKCQNNKID